MEKRRKATGVFTGAALAMGSITLGLLTTDSEAAARGRVQIKNNSVLSDKGTLLRGRPLDMQNERGWRQVSLDPKTYTETAAKGFNCIRLIIRLNAQSIADIDKAVDNAEKAGMYVLVNNHFFREATTENLTEWWTKNAPRWKDRTHVIYEIANEPEYAHRSVNTPEFQEKLFKLVRGLAPKTHIICWSAAKVPSVEKIAQAKGIDYSNASVGFHIYGSSRQSIINLKAKYPVICTEDWLSHSIVSMGEDLGISWIPWVRRSGGDKTPEVFFPEMERVMTRLGKSYVWTPDFQSPTALSGLQSHTVHSAELPMLRLEKGRLSIMDPDGNRHDTRGRHLK